MRVPDDVFAQICAELEAAERSGELDGIFKGEPRAPDQQAGRKPFLHSFSCDMRLYKSTFLKIYGYDITTPGFAEDALTRLEFLGCSRAREYYRAVVLEWQYGHDKEMRSAAHWYKGHNFDRREMRQSREQRIQNLTREQLTELCQRLLEDGIISDPEQFVTAVLQDL